MEHIDNEQFNANDYQGRSNRQVRNNYKASFYNIVFGAICLLIYLGYEFISIFI